MTKLLLAFLVLAAGTAMSQTIQEFYTKAQEARKAGDGLVFYENILKSHELNPYHQGILYQCGIASALTGKTTEAITYLKRAIHVNAEFDLGIAELKNLQDLDAFKKLLTLQNDLRKKIISSDTAFIIPQRTLHLESVATGEHNDVFYFGTIHKRNILKRDAKGKISNFTQPAQDGLASVFGIKVDNKAGILWACSSPMEQMENYDTITPSAVFKYDTRTGKLMKKYSAVSGKKKFVFGDLFLAPGGTVYVSDSRNNIIFKVNEQKGILEEFFTSDQLWNLQGLTQSDDWKYFFIADYVKGIFRLDVATKDLIQLQAAPDVSLKSVDGLTFYKNSLIAIQNGVNPMRVTRYFLDASSSTLTSFTILDRGHPAFNEPTIGCIQGDTFFYVANSLWTGYDDKNQLKAADQLQDVVILKSKLRN